MKSVKHELLKVISKCNELLNGLVIKMNIGRMVEIVNQQSWMNG